jgi:16S rRNA (uracil1498-N3)-methyltransferase
MRVPRVFVEQSLQAGQIAELDERAAHYIGQVLRMRAGRELILFNGDGNAYAANIIDAGKKQLRCQLDQAMQTTQTPSPLKIELGIAISKGDRFDWVIQKATELGVTKISPVFSERVDVKLSGERLEKKQRHWQQIMISACEQCGRNELVDITQASPLAQWSQQAEGEVKLVLCPAQGELISQNIQPKSLALLVGPEGGLSDQEIARCLENDFHALQLGPRILRTETAPIAAISIVQYRWGDMHW